MNFHTSILLYLNFHILLFYKSLLDNVTLIDYKKHTEYDTKIRGKKYMIQVDFCTLFSDFNAIIKKENLIKRN